MDAAGLEAAIDSRDRLIAEVRRAMPDTVAKSEGLLDASSIRAAARIQIAHRLLNKPIESAGRLVRSNLLIPSCGIKLRVPRAERLHVVGRKLLDRGFNVFNGAHGPNYSDPTDCPQRIYSAG